MRSDLFNGLWLFNPATSQLISPPLNWTQQIEVSNGRISVREEITRAPGTTSVVTVNAVPDGSFYPVIGSPIADSIAYQVDGAVITGIAHKGQSESLRERLVFTETGTMTMTFSIIVNTKEVASGSAVFHRLT